MAWKIPLYRIYNDKEDIEAVEKVIGRGAYWTNGPENLQLEKDLSSYVGSKFALTFVNGTSALHAMLLAYGIGPGDEVIVPSFTFISTANSVLFTGAKPVFADIENVSLALDPDDVKKRITKKTKAIMPIHYGGSPAVKINELRELASENDLLLLEDAAESLGASLNGKKVGALGDSAIFSFCANKLITAGEGGAIVTDSEDIYEKLKLIRSHGRAENENYFESNKLMSYVTLGYNFRMSTVVAALTLSQLRKIDRIIKKRRAAAERYRNVLSQPDVEHPADGNGISHVYQMYSIRLDPSKRAGLMDHLKKDGIMSKIYFPPVHEEHFYKNVLGYKLNLPNTEETSGRILSLPIFADMQDNEIDAVCNSIKDFLR